MASKAEVAPAVVQVVVAAGVADKLRMTVISMGRVRLSIHRVSLYFTCSIKCVSEIDG
jgi:hypothetical protein